MTNFLYQHRKSGTILNNIDEARSAILSLSNAEDSEIVIARYKTDDDFVKSIIGVCHNDGENKHWTLFSYDDEMIENLTVGGGGDGGDVNLSAYLKKSEFGSYSSQTQTTINQKVNKDEFSTYKESVTSELNGKVNKTTYEAFVNSTNNILQGKADLTYVDETFVRQGELVGQNLVLQNINGDEIDNIDLSSLVNKGMVESVEIDEETKELVITWNADADNKVTRIPLSDIFDPENFYTKKETDNRIESRHVFFEKYEDYEKAAKQSGVTYYVEDAKIIAHNNVEFQSLTWKTFLEVEEEYMQVAVFNKATEKIEVYYGSELEDMPNVSNFVPVGVVVIPKEHDVYEDESCAVMSLVSMSYETPDVGNVGKTIGQTGDHDYCLQFGHSGYSNSGTIESEFPHLGTMDNEVKGSVQGKAKGRVEIPNDIEVGVPSISDPFGKYYKSTDSDRYYGISPYSGQEEERNDMYSTYSMDLYNGKERTAEILEFATAQTSWRTDEKLTNSRDSGYYPAACTTWRFHTEGTEQGDWFLPSASEIGYICARVGKIGRTLEFINKKFGQNLTTPIDTSHMNNMWSSSINAVDSMTCYGTGTSNIVSRSLTSSGDETKQAAQVRALLKLKY